MIESIWTNQVKMPTFPSLEQDIRTDVLVIGGGMAGILCAHMLQQAGAKCVLIEADRIFGGVTRNTTAKLTSQHGLIYHKLIRQFDADTAQGYWTLNEQALKQYRLLAKNIPCDFETKDSYVFSTDFPDKLAQEHSALTQLGIPADFVSTPKLPFPTAGAIRIPNQAQFHPLKFGAGIARDLHIFEHTAAREFWENTVLTDHGRITASAIIVATHFPLLNKHGSYFLKLYQQRSYVVAYENAPELDGMYLDAAENGLSLRNYGGYLLLGGGGHRTGKPGPGWTHPESVAELYFPDSREVCRWATQDCMTLDGLPYIGQYSKRTPGLYVATGFNKWGMTGSMAAAMVLSDLVRGIGHPMAAALSPSRSMLHLQLLKNAAESTVHLLCPTRPRCPHLGCALTWNRQERSWDCPCHGSRFSEHGDLLDNPATGPISVRPPE